MGKAEAKGASNKSVPAEEHGGRRGQALEDGDGKGRGIESKVSGNEAGSEMGVEALNKELLVDEFCLDKRLAFLEEISRKGGHRDLVLSNC